MSRIPKLARTRHEYSTATETASAKVLTAFFTAVLTGFIFCGATSAGDAETESVKAIPNSPPQFLHPPTPSLNVRPSEGVLPENQAAKLLANNQEDSEFASPEMRAWGGMNYMWMAPSVAYRPLYFEDDQLERYGHHHGVMQPAVSTAKFFGRVTAFPYMVGATPCRECQYPQGYYRPGDCVPEHCTRPKASVRGTIYEAIAITGGVFVIP